MRRITGIALAACLVFGISSPVMAREQAMSKDQMKKLVIEVIQENPDLIYEAYKKHEAKAKQMQISQTLDTAFQNRVTDEVSKDSPSRGPEKAPITIITYMDFQCPYCARGSVTVNQLLAMYPQKIRFVFKNNTLASHGQAIPAARAALAANKQGKFWEYHDRLFQNASSLNEGLYVKIATDLGLDIARFNKDRASEAVLFQIQKETSDFSKLGLSGVPTFLVNGVVVRGAKSADYFKQVIDRLLKEKK